MYLILLIRLFYNEPLSGVWTTFIFVPPLLLNPHLSIFRTFSGSILTLCIHLSSTCHYTSKRNHCLVMSLSKHSWTTPQFPHTSAHCCLCRRPHLFFSTARTLRGPCRIATQGCTQALLILLPRATMGKLTEGQPANGQFSACLVWVVCFKMEKLERYCVIFVMFVAFMQSQLSKQLQLNKYNCIIHCGNQVSLEWNVGSFLASRCLSWWCCTSYSML